AQPREDRALHPVRRLRAAGGRGARDRRSGRGLGPRRRDGRPLRPQPHHRPRRGARAAPAFGEAVRRPPDDRAGRPVPGSVRRSGRGRHHRPPGGRAASAPDDPAYREPGQAGGCLPEPGDPDGGARLRAGGGRPRAGDERQPGLWRAGLHRRPAPQGGGGGRARFEDRQTHRGRGRRRRRPGDRAPGDRRGGDRARRGHCRLPGRARRLPRQHRGLAGRRGAPLM
ncbi:MAG: Ribulose-phosphate 3-epimerase, partial [uncultured Sphingomonadaceae bacterium]